MVSEIGSIIMARIMLFFQGHHTKKYAKTFVKNIHFSVIQVIIMTIFYQQIKYDKNSSSVTQEKFESLNWYFIREICKL